MWLRMPQGLGQVSTGCIDCIPRSTTSQHQTQDISSSHNNGTRNHEKQAVIPQIVAKSEMPEVSAQVLNEAQLNDLTLEELWASARGETQPQTRENTIYRYEVQREILC